MKKYLFILWWLLILRKLSAIENQNPKLDEYLREKSEVIRKQLIQQTDMETNELELLGTYQHSSNQTFDQNIFTFFNKTFFTIGDEIFLGTLNGTLNMDEYGYFKHKNANYFKAFEYNQTGFLAFNTEDEISMYIFVENSTGPKLIQEIFSPYFSSGIFFTNANSLYFASSTNHGEHIGLIKIYKWLGSHFDEIETIHTTGAVTMGSFPYQNLEIIVVGQSLPKDDKVSSSVFEFKQDNARKIQLLDTAKPTHMDIFFQNAVPYVLIYEDLKSQKLFKWNGFEMVLVNRFQWEHKVDKSIVVYSNTIPLIVQPQLDKVFVFKPQNDDILLYQTSNYMENYSIILDISKKENGNGNIIFIGGLNEHNIINIYAMSFKALTEIEREQEETLLKCFNNLEQEVYDRREKLNQTSNGRVEASVTEEVISISRNKRDVPDETGIENVLEDIKTRLSHIKPIIINYGNSTNEFVVNGQAVIKSITAKNVETKKLKFEVVNGRKWTPDRWLRYNQKQTVTGPVKISKIKTKVLVANGDAGKLFQNLLRNNGNQHIYGNFKINQLLTSKIYTKEINGIEIDNICKHGDSLIIKGVKSFNNFSAKKAYIDEINGKKTEEILAMLQDNNKTNRKLAAHVKIDNLDVETIDKINWRKFEESVFKIGEDDFIEGNLSAPEIAITKLQAKTINGIDTWHLMTTSTDQIINSTIEFNDIKAPSIKCETVNDIDITKAVLMKQNGTVIKGPVRIKEIHVKNDLKLVDTPSSSIKKDDHVFGTNHSDLLQRYLGKVVVNGNLYINNFSTLVNTTVFFKGNEYTMDVLNEYWNKNGNQTVPVHFKATNGISTPHLKIKSLNQVPMENFALNLKNSQIRSPLLFKNVTVNGNVILKKSNATNSIDLSKLAIEGVKRNGKTYHIKGKKVFKKTLIAKILETQAESKNMFSKMLKNVVVKGDLIGNVHADVINNVNMSQYVENILPLNKPQNLTDLDLEDVTVEHLQVNSINGHSIEQYLDKLQNMLGKRNIKQVNIKGNLTLKKVRELETINGHNIDDFFIKDNSQTDKDQDFTGDIKFTGKVKIRNLNAKIINNIDFPSLTKRLFYKTSNQSVTGLYTFANLKTVHLYAKKINEQNVSNLIDISSTKPQQILAPKGIVFKDIKLEKSITAKEMVPCDINKAMKKIHSPETQEWAEVEIFGNVTFLDENCELLRILEKSVKTGQKNTILAPVTIQGHVLSEQVKVKGNLNDINLSELIADLVLIDSEEEQIITGHKTFNNTIAADTVTVLGNADIPVVNKILIRGLYDNIIKREHVNNITILGKKTFFGGLQCNKISAEKIAGIKPENIVSLTNSTQIPSALFDNIDILNNLNVRYINSYELDYVLNNRLLINTFEKQITNAVYYFTDLEIVDNLRTAAINNIIVNDIVFDIKKQKITALKRFIGNVTVYGNIKVDYLNGINVTKEYNDALLRGEDVVSNGSISIMNPVRFEGNITVKTINGYPVEQIKQIINETSIKATQKDILNTQEKIRTIIKNALPAVEHMPNELLYIEKSDDLQVEIPNTIDASITIIKDYALIHIISEESHEKCNLPEGCKCPVQYTVEITPHNSVNYFLNKQQERVYSYDDDTMTVHLSTNSISYSTQCRTNQTGKIGEVSIMTWTSTTTGNITGSFHTQPVFSTGYISGAEFFTLNGVAYAIVAQYYDSISDSYNLNCSIIRFSEDKSSISEIQQIATHGAKTLYLLHTAQGIILVIGNLAQKPYTEMYRFNENKQHFELLRTVNYGCSKAAGVVLGTDSLIILANGDAPLQVLKYHEDWDNYYYYQMFALEEPIMGLSVFYVGGFGISDAYLCIITEDNYRIYSFQYIDGWKLEARGAIRGLKNLVPFELNGRLYLFAPSTYESSLLRVVKHGTGET